jgi:hypothetical protein
MLDSQRPKKSYVSQDAGDSRTSPTLRLPEESVDAIVKEAAISLGESKPDFSTLKNVSLVNKQWNGIVQLHLYGHISLRISGRQDERVFHAFGGCVHITASQSVYPKTPKSSA